MNPKLCKKNPAHLEGSRVFQNQHAVQTFHNHQEATTYSLFRKYPHLRVFPSLNFSSYNHHYSSCTQSIPENIKTIVTKFNFFVITLQALT